MSRRVLARVLRAALLIALLVEVALILCAFLLPPPAEAAIIGWRIEARACQRAALCANFPSGRTLWRGRYACQKRAETLEAAASDMPPQALGLPKGTHTYRVRCAPVEGLPDA